MTFFLWLKVLYRFRKWLVSGLFGILILTAGTIVIFKNINLKPSAICGAAALILAGLALIFICVKKIFLGMLRIYSAGTSKSDPNVKEIGKFLYRKKFLEEGPRVVVLGGGTGISTMLRGLKAYTSNITAIITVADDGGSSGVLRKHLGILPPGDIRNCLLALAETEPIMERLLQYRFKEGMFKGQSFGNLFIAAMNGISGSFVQAVRSMNDVLAVTGTVMPVTEQNIHLCAELEDGFIIEGESKIGNHNEFHPGRIKRVFLSKENVKPLPQVLDALKQADLIVLGPGSLYTSIIPNILVNDIAKTIKRSPAPKVYVCNIMTQPGETDGYSALDHIESIEKHGQSGMIDYCIVNNKAVPEKQLDKYKEQGAELVRVEYAKIKKMGIKVIGEDLAGEKDGYVRHNPERLAYAVMRILKDR